MRTPDCEAYGLCCCHGLKFLGLHLVRPMVFSWPASDSFFVSQIVMSVVLTGPATDEILEPQIERWLLGWAISTAMWDLCETWVFLAAGTWEFPVSGLVYLAGRPANVCPRVPLGCLYVVK